ncbi:hypothetical protein KIN20_026865 [Parelaphostrongylus tenuis]|uniref:Uncharacterized protein n=1 Tax=Parelaphostrongylus tenuis TaxID=148309 RepID=A0AAD5QYK7_PARTN|nr:hypothetical protein KIN20_026865 [Parelaphostrongylus tenuis]
MNENELLQAKLSESEECPSKLFRMGCTPNDTAFTKYINFYVDHKFGEHPVTRKKMIDKKKYLCSKFSLMEDGEWAFEWSLAKGHNLYGSERLQTLYIAWTIGKLLRKIPVDLMQRKWRDALPSFKKEALDVFDEDIVVVKHTKFPQGISRELTRMRDEKYRLYGRGDLGGWIWISRTLVRDIRVKPEEEEITKRKSRRLETIVSRLMDWRLAQEMKGQDQKSGQCHPPGCRSDSAMSDTTTDHQSCYSQDGRRRELDVDDRDFSPPPDELEASSVNTSRIVKAFDQSKVPTIRKGVLGEDLPWPLPDVNKFVSRGSKRTSIFVIPQITLRQLAKTGGRKAIYIPSFSSSAKGNLQYWNYPAPRPCFDLCWRWLTANCKSLQSVALQLRILWASVRWMDMKPEDDDPDRRVVIHYPDRDERQRISFHKEFGPPCIYERYRLSIEVIPLDDDNAVDEEDDSTWAGSERERRRSTRRRKTVQSSNVRRVSHIKEEWVDGVDLKLYEIYDYWKAYNNRPTTSNRQSRLVQKAQSAATSGGRSTSSVPNASNLRNAVAVQSNLRHSYSRPTPSSASLLHHAPTFTTERKRKPSRREDYEYYGFDDDFDDEDDYDSRPNASSEHTGWEPRAAKRRLVSSMDSKQTCRTVVPTSRSSIERSYPVGVLRRGDRNTVPVGDGMEQMEGLIEEGVVPLGAEETIVTTAESSGNQTSARPASSSTRQVFRDGVGDGDGGPPVMQRYEDVNDSYGGRTVSRVLPSSSARTRVVHRSPAVVSRSNVAVPSAAGKLLMVRRSDGTTQFLRQIPQHSGRPLSSQLPVMRARAPQTAVQTVHGSKLVHIAREDQDQSTPTRVVMPARPAPRVVRTGYGQAVDPFMTRMAVEKTGPGGDVVPSGLVRGHVVRPARGYEQVGAYGASDGRAMENVSYSEHMARVQTSTERTPLPSGYTQRSIIRKVAPRGSAPSTQGVPPNNNSHRVYYVKNPIATPSRVVLAPASVKTDEHEEIVLDNGDQVVDAGEIEDHTQPQHPS